MSHRIFLASVLLVLCACTAGQIQLAGASFEESIHGGSIVQGPTANCFLISVLRQLADKDVSYIKHAITTRSEGMWHVRLYIDGQPQTFCVDVTDLEGTYAMTTDGSRWANIIEAAFQKANVNLNFGDASLAMRMMTGMPTRAQHIDIHTASAAVALAKEGLPSVVCSTRHTTEYTPYHCFGLHMTQDGRLQLEDPLTQGDERLQFVTQDALQTHFAYAIQLGH